MTTLQEKHLGQVAPAVTGVAASLYSPGAGVTGIVKSIFVCNTTNAPATFDIYFDDNGSVAAAANALFYQQTIAAKSTLEINTFIAMNDSSGNILVAVGTANAITFSAFGAEITS